MKKWTTEQIIAAIQKGELFEAQCSTGSYQIAIKRYVPFVCAAIHDGSNMPEFAQRKIALDDYSRWYEEDPETAKFIDSLPITISGLDSRYAYDLNRGPEECVFDEAWGKKVWAKNLTTKEKNTLLKRHQDFYRVVDALVQALSERFKTCIIYDIHSYNYKRWEREVPLFNIGTEQLPEKGYDEVINHWSNQLQNIAVKEFENKTTINDVFKGRGYFLKHVTSRFPEVLVLATEIKKIYCNELTGENHPKIIRSIQLQLKQAILNNALYFAQQYTSWLPQTTGMLLDQNQDKDLQRIDGKLYRLLKNFELLYFINPANVQAEKRKFFNNTNGYQPHFSYRPIKISPYELKQTLSSLRMSDISDVTIRLLYEVTVSSYFDKIDLLSSLNSQKFLYNSLRYFGRPNKSDIKKAQYLLHLPPSPHEPKKVPVLPQEKVVQLFQEGNDYYGFNAKIESSNRVISRVMVLNSKQKILFNPKARFTEKETKALVEHEIGVHMVTTQNSLLQPLKLFNLGLPVNTKTQEGIAVLSEYLSSNITLKRLQQLALRVLAVDAMYNGADFMECYRLLHEEYKVEKESAFDLTTRVYRGGGFTKDHLYLSGFISILKAWEAGTDLAPLLVGKTSLPYLDTISEMIDRGMLQAPKYITQCLKNNEHQNDPIYEYIISGLVD